MLRTFYITRLRPISSVRCALHIVHIQTIMLMDWYTPYNRYVWHMALIRFEAMRRTNPFRWPINGVDRTIFVSIFSRCLHNIKYLHFWSSFIVYSEHYSAGQPASSGRAIHSWPKHFFCIFFQWTKAVAWIENNNLSIFPNLCIWIEYVYCVIFVVCVSTIESNTVCVLGT